MIYELFSPFTTKETMDKLVNNVSKESQHTVDLNS